MAEQFQNLVTITRGASNITISLNAQTGDLHLGGEGVDGDIILRSTTGQNRIRLDANGANGWFGGNGADGDLVLFAAGGNNTSSNQATIHLDGGSGDIILRNADFAEDFDIAVAQRAKVEPGSVMVLDPLGNLVECTKGYDKKVTGVISGAGQYKPGIIMDKQENSENRMPVSLTGKVMCKVDTKYGAIEAGDLLTTSPTEGYAMKASDSFKSVGAIIGKALKPFKEGKGMLPILVSMH